MDNILSLALYSLIYFCRPLYILLYTTQPRIFYTTLIYSLIRLYTLLYTLYVLSLIYSFIYSLLSYTLIALLILPRHFIPLPSLSYILLYTSSLSYILAPYFHIPLLSNSTLILLYPLSYIEGYNYAAADFYTLYIAILIFTAALISQLPYYIAFKEWKRRRQEL